MSDTTTTNTSGTCELVLDYVYGELDEARKRTFEEHLPTCARCQQEVASFGRVRAAVKRVMPAVEPSTSLGGGALHAQLMHAAAQRRPRRGVLLAFPRKVMQHPALSAAAMFAI
ncbi:MAG TPA: zf-HC2 domain-containing protein, partial [Polyangia bacterium]